MERVLANKANYLAAKGHELVIITTDQKGRGPNFPLHPAIRQIDLGINYTDDQDLGMLRKIWSFKKDSVGTISSSKRSYLSSKRILRYRCLTMTPLFSIGSKTGARSCWRSTFQGLKDYNTIGPDYGKC
ncbi:hypothetical protein KUH03_31530 [Sphingobacterium sp. E70]|uniref:hypothetical protein n=1 Tax=Sphingobacterium sp. E70 TaxID=2853439 RepID=UPI00211CC754|nr:hypothetical protein [Sphingobacterium sp. E70]ULT23656.1 hypothetical protein KUH03_31530 [Sphingobacterium sp. E70]